MLRASVVECASPLALRRFRPPAAATSDQMPPPAQNPCVPPLPAPLLHNLSSRTRSGGLPCPRPAGTTDNSPQFQLRVAGSRAIQVPEGRPMEASTAGYFQLFLRDQDTTYILRDVFILYAIQWLVPTTRSGVLRKTQIGGFTNIYRPLMELSRSLRPVGTIPVIKTVVR